MYRRSDTLDYLKLYRVPENWKNVIVGQAYADEIIDDGAGQPRDPLPWAPPQGWFRYARRLPRQI